MCLTNPHLHPFKSSMNTNICNCFNMCAHHASLVSTKQKIIINIKEFKINKYVNAKKKNLLHLRLRHSMSGLVSR